jgi:putative protease
MTELLAPAGGWDSLVAAVQNGADAVYLGFGSFNARRSAKNFTREEVARAVSYCHERGVRVYLTLNTLLTDRELPEAADNACFASDCGVDAVLVQDWGVWQMLRACAPDLPIHASTQMSLHTLGGANRAAALGAERVVLARELSKTDIAQICRDCPAEIEVFVHGALCMCYSGQCAMSALIGGRSGNRGRCAQPCRMIYSVNGGSAGHPLSLKDYNLSAKLQELSDMGVACLKLEGRMKRSEYVAVVTGIYHRLLEEKRGPTAEETKALTDAFSRSGFTDWYYQGKKGAGMFGVRPEDTPEPKELFARAKALYEKENLRLIDVNLTLCVAAGKPMTLTAEADGKSVCLTGEVPQNAAHRSATAEELTARLEKTGGTAYRCRHAAATVEEGLYVSAAAINDLRRRTLNALSEARTAMPPRRTFPLPPFVKSCPGPETPPQFTVSITRAEQLTAELLACSPAAVYVPLELLGELDLPAIARQTAVVAVLPRIFRTDDEPVFRARLAEAAPHLSAVAVGNLGHFPLAEGLNLPLWGDFGLNVFSSAALAFLREQGLSAATVSFELRLAQIRDLDKVLPCEAIVYGRLPLMLTENCLIRNSGACNGHQLRCRENNTLTDRTGAAFPLMNAYGCRTEIENSRVLFLADRSDYQRLGLTYARLRFTDELPAQCVEVFRAYLGQSDYRPADFTRGLYDRGVE